MLESDNPNNLLDLIGMLPKPRIAASTIPGPRRGLGGPGGEGSRQPAAAAPGNKTGPSSGPRPPAGRPRPLSPETRTDACPSPNEPSRQVAPGTLSFHLLSANLGKTLERIWRFPFNPGPRIRPTGGKARRGPASAKRRSALAAGARARLAAGAANPGGGNSGASAAWPPVPKAPKRPGKTARIRRPKPRCPSRSGPAMPG